MNEKEILLGYAKRGEPKAQSTLSSYYMFGNEDVGIEADEAQRKFWYSELYKQAVAGNLVAQGYMAVSHSLQETLFPTSSEEDVLLIRQGFADNIFALADAGNAEAIVSKADVLYLELTSVYPKNEENEKKCIELLTTAAEAGNARACKMLYQYYSTGGISEGFSLFAIDGLENMDEYIAQRKDAQKEMYYLQKGASSTDYYNYECKWELARKYYATATAEGYSPEDRKKFLESFKYWMRAAAESGSLEAFDMEKNVKGLIEHVYQIYPELGRTNYNYVSSKAATPTQGKKGGCYVATCVYGSYDCPEVWVLRRYRDIVLADTLYGRAFIRFYYWAGPKAVKWFGETAWFHLLFKKPIDGMVNRLKNKGFMDTPYQD